MKPAAIALTVAGAGIILGGIWASLVLPLRTNVHDAQSPSGGRVVNSLRLNLWGKELHQTTHVTFYSEEMKPHGEGIGPIAEEWIESGALDWSGGRHGPWTLRERNGTIWTESVLWFLDHKPVTREEWERQK